MKKTFISTLQCLLVAFVVLCGATQSFAGITVNLTSPTTTYTAGASNTFTLNVNYTFTGAEWVDRFQFVFPAGVTVTSATPVSGSGLCASNAGIQTIVAPGQIIAWHRNTVPATGAFAPTGCGAYSTNNATISFVITADVAANVSGPLSITLNSIGDGFLLPAGSVDTDNVSIAQNLPCTISCPASVTYNLQGGECNAAHFYNVTSAGNCVVDALGPFSQTQNNNTTLIDNAVDCSASPVTSIWRAFNSPTGTFTVNSVTFGSFNAANVRVVLYSYTGTVGATTLDIAQMTQIATSNTVAAPGGSQLFTVNLTAPVVIPGGSKYVVEIRKESGGPFVVGTNTGGQTAPCYATCPSAGITVPTAFGTLNGALAGIHALMLVNGQAVQQVPATLQQTAGLPSGSLFPIGTTVNTFAILGPNGTPLVPSVTCSFSVTVNEFPNPVTYLTCNDLVQISLDEDCSVVVGADQILEGGPYSCYDDYIVEIDRTPLGNGPWTPPTLGASDVGKTYDVRVRDAAGNICWGKIKVEDKLPPVLDCDPFDVVCNDNASPNTPLQIAPISKTSANFAIPASGTNSTTINVTEDFNILDLDIDFVTNHTWVGDIAVRVTSPSGTTVTFVDRPGVPGTALGCAGNGLDLLLDDEATNAYSVLEATCGNNPAIAGTFQPANPLSAFNGESTVGTWTITAEDFVAGDGATNSVATLIFSVNAPGTRFPNGLVLNTNIFQGSAANVYTVPAGALDACSASTLSYTDVVTPEDCASGLTSTITRTWVAVDASGNSSTCVQEIGKIRPTLDDVVLPGDYDGVDLPYLACGSQFPTPSVMNALGLQGTPRVFGSTDGCSINWDYDDLVIAVCDGTYKIKRTWTIIDWCTGTGFDYVQLIKVADDAGPSIDVPANLTVSTDPYTCCATVDLPNVIVADDCSRINNVGGFITGFDPNTGEVIGTFPISGTLTSFPGNNLWTPDTLANYGFSPCLPLGTHTVTYIATDDCGNTASATFRVTVRDYTPPQVASDELTVVSIGLDDPFDCYFPNAQPGDCSAGGISWVKASTFDDGSYDNCGAVKFTIQRMQPYSDCILALNGTNGFDVNGPNPDGAAANCFDIFPDFPSEFERAITEGDSIKFYCCEVGTTQQVIFRVYQLNPDGSFAIGADGLPVVASTMVNVQVQDKLKPVCQAPANVTVSCEAFDPSLWAYGNAVPSDNCCLDTTKVYQGQCGLTHATVLTQFDSLCNKGTITRRWTAYDCHGQTSQCTQRIIVTYNQNYWVKFPADRLVSTCDGTTAYGAPEYYGEDCELLATSYTDEFFTVVPDACYKIERTWRVINWCTYNPNNSTCQFVPNPNPNNTTNHPTNLPGVTVSPLGTTVPGWAPTVVRINPTDPQPTNYSTFWNKETNCYTYKQIIKVYDTQDPTVAPAPTEFCDLSANDPQFYNAMQYWDAGIASHDLCEGDANIEITATDACSGAALNFRYLLFLDLDGNGSMETVVNSVAPLAYNTLFYDNANNPNFGGGTPWNFDFRPVPNDRKWAFGLQVDNAAGNSRTARVRWVNQVGQNAVPQLPYGNHKIKWFVEDGCGNETVYEHAIVVKDCKKPTVVCLNGLSVNLMNVDGGMIALWASDFLQYTEDNCTPANLIKIGIRRVGQADGQGNTTGFPKNANGTPQTGVNFTCADLGTQLVELWGLDVAGNADYCETYVLIQDNAGVCGTNADIAGALKNEGAQGVEDANVELEGSSANGIPAFGEVFSQVTGEYMFSNALPFSGNATVTPTMEIDPLNGVNTWDLILISRHILGLEPLNTPYKLIAADANKSGTVTTFDIVELRKLILGTYQQLPNNSSWRFVDKSQVFTNPANPFADVIRENIQIANIQTNISNGDFVAAKIGDVDGTATPNNLVASDDRTAGTLLFDIQDRAVKAGETFTVNFKAADKAAGYQFTMNTTNLEVVDILPGEKMTTENFAVFADAITTSADDTNGEFAVTFRATAEGQLSNMLAVSSRITKAVAFDGASKLNVAFRFNNGGNSTIAGVGFELYQNSPNPFVNKTFVGFHLPEATSATLSVYDETGRVLYTTTGDFGKGYNAISLDRTTLNANGVLYYKLETTTDSATKKMIQTSK